jgi:hypothetical protein
MNATIRTDNPDLRKEFLCLMSDNYENPLQERSGRLLVSVGQMVQEGEEYVFSVEYV